jgi:hypothetical protein
MKKMSQAPPPPPAGPAGQPATPGAAPPPGQKGDPNTIEITVRRESTGEETKLDVDMDATVGELKETLTEAGLMENDAAIYYKDKDLDDGMTFRKVGIQTGDVLQIGGSTVAGSF